MMIKGKHINDRSIEFEGVDLSDYPDFCDSFVSYAEFDNGDSLNDKELDLLQDLYAAELNELLFDLLY